MSLTPWVHVLFQFSFFHELKMKEISKSWISLNRICSSSTIGRKLQSISLTRSYFSHVHYIKLFSIDLHVNAGIKAPLNLHMYRGLYKFHFYRTKYVYIHKGDVPFRGYKINVCVYKQSRKQPWTWNISLNIHTYVYIWGAHIDTSSVTSLSPSQYFFLFVDYVIASTTLLTDIFLSFNLFFLVNLNQKTYAMLATLHIPPPFFLTLMDVAIHFFMDKFHIWWHTRSETWWA